MNAPHWKLVLWPFKIHAPPFILPSLSGLQVVKGVLFWKWQPEVLAVSSLTWRACRRTGILSALWCVCEVCVCLRACVSVSVNTARSAHVRRSEQQQQRTHTHTPPHTHTAGAAEPGARMRRWQPSPPGDSPRTCWSRGARPRSGRRRATRSGTPQWRWVRPGGRGREKTNMVEELVDGASPPVGPCDGNHTWTSICFCSRAHRAAAAAHLHVWHWHSRHICPCSAWCSSPRTSILQRRRRRERGREGQFNTSKRGWDAVVATFLLHSSVVKKLLIGW